MTTQDTSDTVPQPSDAEATLGREWVANIKVEKNAVKTTFFVQIFLGDFNPDPKKWGEDPNLVGSHVVFAGNTGYGGNPSSAIVTGTIPLTRALKGKLGADHLDPAKAVPYLRSNLHWRIHKGNRTPIDVADIPSFKLSVAHATVQAPDTPSGFPKWGPMKVELDVTAGRPGGADRED